MNLYLCKNTAISIWQALKPDPPFNNCAYNSKSEKNIVYDINQTQKIHKFLRGKYFEYSVFRYATFVIQKEKLENPVLKDILLPVRINMAY